MSVEIIYSFPVYASFVRNDEALFKENFLVRSFHFNQKNKLWIPFELLRHILFCLRHVRRTKAYISFFAGYSSLVPSVLAKVFNKPHIIILGGTDCTSIPEINYGNYRKIFLGWCTRKSIELATTLLPVSQNLIISDYTYTRSVNAIQGFKHFCNKVQAKIEVVPLGYNHQLFHKKANKVPNSFLCVAQITKANYYRKGIDLIIELAREFPSCSFTIIGNSGFVFNNLPENLTILPFVSYDELAAFYSRSEYYLQLSMMEGFPSALCEAMLCECIPIVSKVGAMAEIVGEDGFILHHKDIDELHTLIREALKCNRIEKGKLARERIMKYYSVNVRKRIIEVITGELT